MVELGWRRALVLFARFLVLNFVVDNLKVLGLEPPAAAPVEE